ncbi:MAG: DUF1905 domain-containing protein [bacterium]
MSESFNIKSKAEIFPQKGGWVFVRVPKKYTEVFKSLADRGLVAITVTLGKNTWDTSLMPMGDGTQFIPLSAGIRKKDGIMIGDRVKLSFVLRKC